MSAIVLRADAQELPLPDASVDLVVTSPPYFGLRSYIDGGKHYAGQIGDEETPASYVAALVDCTREWMRVLKPTGSIMVNLGDKYANDAKWGGATGGRHVAGLHGQTGIGRAKRRTGIPPKSLMLLPERYRIACVDQLGLTARAVLVWDKPNGLPESVQDRVRRSHEDWVHLTKQPHYFSAVDAIRTPAVRDDARASGKRYSSEIPGIGRKHQGLAAQPNHALGSLPGSVWRIATEPLSVPAELGVDHFAAFPTEWPRQLILGWSPSGICAACGEGRRPVSASQITADRGRRQFNPSSGNVGVLGKERVYRITGEACACPESTAPTRPSVIVDPFGGTGTTALVAHALGRIGITVDRSADYCRIARWRTTDPDQIAKAMRVEKPPTEVAGQLDIFAQATT